MQHPTTFDGRARLSPLALALAVTAAFPGAAAAQCPPPSSGVALASGTGTAGALAGDTAVVGDPLARRARVFERDLGGSGAWGLAATLLAGDPEFGDDFGHAVAVHADRAVVGAPDHGAFGEGAVYVFERDAGGAGAWDQVAVLTATTTSPANARVGFSVAVYGDTILAGAPDLTHGNIDAGGVFVFERDSGTGAWNQLVQLDPPTISLGDAFGWAVALQGDTAAIAEPGDGAGWFPGSVFVHERDLGGPASWGKSKRVRAGDKEPDAWFGGSLDLFGDTLLVGSPYHDHGGVAGSGAAYLFERDLGGPDAWGQRQELLAAAPLQANFFAYRVALDGDLALVSHDPNFVTPDELHLFARGMGAPDVWTPGGTSSLSGLRAVQLDGASALLVGASASEVRELTPTPAYAGYCTAGTTGSGCQAVLSLCGTPSASAPSGFLLQAAGAEGQASGIFYFGTGGRQALPWGNGSSFQCVTPPVTRGPLLVTSGTGGACDGTAAHDLNAQWWARPAQTPAAGTLVQAQFWFRDPASTSNRKTSLSDAAEFAVAP